MKGKVCVIHAFQMLCPGCTIHGIPQAKEVARTFKNRDVEVIGLHSVFEHKEAMQDHVLEVFLHEYQIQFPVGVDQSRDGFALPATMAAYEMQGTPTTILIDRNGRLCAHHFGQISDLILGQQIGSLLAGEPPS